MKEVTSGNFGLVITYLLPGFVALWGVAFFSESVRTWLMMAPDNAPTVGGFVFATFASMAAGLIASAVRWAVVDRLHALTGLSEPDWDFSRLQSNLAAFRMLHDIHYRYYKFYSNSLISVLFLYASLRLVTRFQLIPLGVPDVGFVLLSVLLFAGSRDTLRRYYHRGRSLLGDVNGSHHADLESPVEHRDFAT